jgi:hypothetical protein
MGINKISQGGGKGKLEKEIYKDKEKIIINKTNIIKKNISTNLINKCICKTKCVKCINSVIKNSGNKNNNKLNSTKDVIISNFDNEINDFRNEGIRGLFKNYKIFENFPIKNLLEFIFIFCELSLTK